MALVLLNNTGISWGQFDGYDGATFLGGEVATLVGYTVAGTDKHAKDVDDGYANSALSPFQRPIVTTTLTSSSKPLFLVDDSTTGANYGTLFGTLVGSICGQGVTGTAIGPGTNTGSGKVTLWSNPGLYGVTTDAVDTAADGLVVTNGALAVGTPLVYTSTGKLTPDGSSADNVSAPVVARFVEFSASDTLVTTPRSLTRTGVSGGQLSMKYVVISWNPPVS